jgi:hypothetical protein
LRSHLLRIPNNASARCFPPVRRVSSAIAETWTDVADGTILSLSRERHGEPGAWADDFREESALIRFHAIPAAGNTTYTEGAIWRSALWNGLAIAADLEAAGYKAAEQPGLQGIELDRVVGVAD